METGGATDPELVARVVNGDEDALAELYDRHADAVFRTAFRFLGDRGQAEEVLQETYLALWNRAELFDPRVGSLSAWLRTIARNRAVDRLRSLGRRPALVPMPAFDDSARDATALDRAVATGGYVGGVDRFTDPDAAAELGWLRSAVRQALALMPEMERRAIELAYYEELSQTEIADRLQWPLGTVKTRTRRALARLRATLAETLGPELGARVAPTESDGSHAKPASPAGRAGHGPR